ncbi:MAG: hypothetical protein ACOCYP_07095, partial [Planctomycetota bacterium]
MKTASISALAVAVASHTSKKASIWLGERFVTFATNPWLGVGLLVAETAWGLANWGKAQVPEWAAYICYGGYVVRDREGNKGVSALFPSDRPDDRTVRIPVDTNNGTGTARSRFRVAGKRVPVSLGKSVTGFVSGTICAGGMSGVSILTLGLYDSELDISITCNIKSVEQGIQIQSNAFAVDILAFCVMSNHMHIVLRTDPEQAQRWSAREVVERWSAV